MNNALKYIKKIIALMICSLSGVILFYYIPRFFYVYIPLLLLAFSIITLRIYDKKPDHLFDYKSADDYFKRGGPRILLTWFVGVAGFVYDVLVWTVWGIYQVFLIITDMIILLKLVVYYIVYAIIMFLRLFVPAIKILFLSLIHYFIKWPWWLFQLAFHNLRPSINRNFYFIGLRGTLPAVLIVFAFFYAGILMNIGMLYIVGILLALLPVTWIFGETAAVRARHLQNENYYKIRANFSNGIESVRCVIFYITFLIVMLIIQSALNLIGWIPDAGVTLAGLAFTVNQLISLLIILVFLIVVFGILIIPSYRLYISFSETNIEDSFRLLKLIIRKGLQYIFVIVPSSIFSMLLAVVPVLFMVMALWLTLGSKDLIIDLKISSLNQTRINADNETEAYRLGKRIDALNVIKQFPAGIVQEMVNRNRIDYEIKYHEDDIRSGQAGILAVREQGERRIAALDSQIVDLSASSADNDQQITGLQRQKMITENNTEKTLSELRTDIQKAEADVEYLQMKKRSLPYMLLFAGIWFAVLASLVIAVIVAYLGNVFYSLYLFRNDGSPSYFRDLAGKEEAKDTKQPLLGFTLLILTIVLVIFLNRLGESGYTFYDLLADIKRLFMSSQ